MFYEIIIIFNENHIIAEKIQYDISLSKKT